MPACLGHCFLRGALAMGIPRYIILLHAARLNCHRSVQTEGNALCFSVPSKGSRVLPDADHVLLGPQS